MTSLLRIPAARTGGRGPAAGLVAAGLAAACLATLLEPGPAGAAGAGRDLRVFTAATQLDTLDHAWPRVLAVVASEFRKDDWVIQSADSADRRVVTRWKPLEHRLARLAFGDVWSRCVVDLAPLPGGRTLVQFRGGLASADELDANPAFPAAALTYQRAAQRFLERVRISLDKNETASRLSP